MSLNLSPKRQGVMIHNYVREVAKGIAADYYEGAARNNYFYKLWPSQKTYISECWPDHVGAARESLTSMLSNPKYTDEQKEQIYEILLLDRTLPKSQTRGLN